MNSDAAPTARRTAQVRAHRGPRRIAARAADELIPKDLWQLKVPGSRQPCRRATGRFSTKKTVARAARATGSTRVNGYHE